MLNGLMNKAVYKMVKEVFMNNIFTKLLLMSISFFTPILPAMLAVGILIAIDTITGVLGARRLGESVNSKKFGRVITKSLVYQLLIISSHLIELYLLALIPLVKITLGFLAITEFLSISENFQKCTGRNFIKYIKEYLDVKFRGMLKK